MMWFVVGIVTVTLVGMLALVFAWAALTERLSGLTEVRAELKTKGLHEQLAELVISELRPQADGAAGGVLLVGLALAALLLGRAANLEPRLEPLFLAVHVPAVCFGLWGALQFNRKPLDLAQSPLYRALFLAPSSVQELAPTIVLLNIDVTGVGDALVRQRVTQLNTPIPHVIIRLRDGGQHLVRGVNDKDFGATQTLGALQKHLPGVPVGATVPRTELPKWPDPVPDNGWLLRLAGIGILTGAASYGVHYLEESRYERDMAAANARVNDALVLARNTSAPATPLQCPLGELPAFDVAFVATRSPAVDWPSMRADVPFTLSRTGASTASGASRYAASAVVQGGGGAVDIELVVVDVDSKQVVCAGHVSGSVDSRQPSRSVDVLVAHALGLGSVL